MSLYHIAQSLGCCRPTKLPSRTLRSYATAARAAKPVASPAPIKTSANLRPVQRPTTSPSSQASQTIQSQLNKQALAERIYNSGRHEIYRAPSHTGLILGAWLIAGSGYLGINHYAKSGMLSVDEMRKKGFPIWVPVVYWAVAGLIGALSGMCIVRSWYFVKSIQLLKENGATRVAIIQRSIIPFRSHRFVIEPYKLKMERKVAMFAENPALMKTDVSRQATVAAEVGGIFKNIALTPYLVVRKLFTHESVLVARAMVSFKPGQEEKDRLLRIDADGLLSNNGKDLVDLATFQD